MSNVKKLMMTAAGGEALNVEDVFSTYLYTGNGTGQTITNGIDLSTEGGLVWMKNRSPAGDHNLYDTERGRSVALRTQTNSAEYSVPSGSGLTSFNTDGFTLGSAYNAENTNNDELVSWTFRKAPKFFDVVTYTGNSTAGRTVSHNLGSTPGCIIIKGTSSNYEWSVYHRGMDSTAPENYYMWLNLRNAKASSAGYWNQTAPTSTQFTLGNNGNVNQSGQSYVAYIFAHNDSDGEFGPTGDQDVIKCGSYTGNGSTDGPDIDLGFEPQWIMVRNTSGTDDWIIVDAMRGIVTGGIDPTLDVNNNLAELVALNYFQLTPTGFKLASSRDEVNRSGFRYIYMAIRRGPMAVPESATDVFAIDQGDSNGTSSVAEFDAGFPVDMGINKATSGSNGQVHTRLTDQKVLYTNYSDAEGNAVQSFDFQNGYYGSDKPSSYYAWMWRRAPSYFDVVAFTAGTSSNRRLDHNLGVAPEMVWVKRRDGVRNWYVYHKDLGDASYGARDYRLYLNSAQAKAGPTIGIWGTSDPTDTDFGLNENDVIGANTSRCIAYMFASAAGVSKVGSFTGTGANGLNIDCGFSSGARFVLIKNVNRSSQWYVWDTERGIVAGNDPWLAFDTAYAQQTSNDYIDPYSAGFTVNYGAADYMNTSGDTHIFYAIA